MKYLLGVCLVIGLLFARDLAKTESETSPGQAVLDDARSFFVTTRFIAASANGLALVKANSSADQQI